MKRRAQDLRDVPAYPLVDAARYLHLPASTLRRWVNGWSYPTSEGEQHSHRLLDVHRSGRSYVLSFNNLIEAHVLASMRFDHKVAMPRVRQALTWVSSQLDIRRPLLNARFESDGISLFVEHLGQVLDVSTFHGQVQIAEAVRSYLRRVERDPEGVPIRLFPWVRPTSNDKTISIDPRFGFGRPVIAGTGVPTRVLFEQFQGGDNVAFLAEDYELQAQQVIDALRFEGAVIEPAA
jgi:uncharacterized protein (DUF433 family)